jgi:hypothetical protein
MSMGAANIKTSAVALCPLATLAARGWTIGANGSRMSREVHVRFSESARVKSPHVTQLEPSPKRGSASFPSVFAFTYPLHKRVTFNVDERIESKQKESFQK